ncbi:pyridoxamine 5'-phosphate oxidase family protein [Streptococcus thoraltensis]|uniref:pyridoxamine 5'-phosphate oxidase family protein n=1 Tax=Streptococcus thoraltensis TaxID=55085 RepID=UPI00035FC112|nr:pyridoxamine 5'-phosphate oxidase family protein [Streptococcus thoraltensis]MDY4761263.1 pyridoxamine 5'-phosphate oxidase family protein [Streptococcus thoraltensis]
MQTADYLTLLVDDIHSVVMATVDAEGLPATRVIDMMYQDGKTAYFLTANTKPFYKQLRDTPYVSVTGLTKGIDTMHRKMVSLTGEVRHIGKEKLDLLLETNPYMYDIYPTEESRQVLEVFIFTKARGEFYDLSVLPPRTDSFQIAI